MSGKLSGKVAVVTGSGGTGIGNAIAKGMAAEGAKVVINDIGTLEDGRRAADVAVDEIINDVHRQYPDISAITLAFATGRALGRCEGALREKMKEKQ